MSEKIHPVAVEIDGRLWFDLPLRDGLWSLGTLLREIGWTPPPEPAGMPVFPIKAKDALAPEAVAAYRDLCERYELHDQAVQVQLALDEITAWQAANEELLKLPDHQHVGVTP